MVTIETNYGIFKFPDDVTLNMISDTIKQHIEPNWNKCNNLKMCPLGSDININELGQPTRFVVNNNNMSIKDTITYKEPTKLEKISCNTIGMDDLKISFHRTLKHKDNSGALKLDPMDVYQSDVTTFVLPSYHSESIWLEFDCNIFYAIKIGVNGVNLVNGEPWTDTTLIDQNFIFPYYTRYINGVKDKDKFKLFIPAKTSPALTFKFEIHKYNSKLENHCVYVPKSNKIYKIEDCMNVILEKDDVFYTYFYGADDSRRMFREYGFPSSIQLMISPILTHQIFVKNEKMYILNVMRDCSVDMVMKKIYYKTGIPIHRQRVIFGGKQLEKGRLLSDYKISEHSTLHTCMRLGGSVGCPQCAKTFYEYIPTSSPYPASAFYNLKLNYDVDVIGHD